MSYSSYTWHISRLITKKLIWRSFFYSSTTGILYFITDQKRWAPRSKFANVTLCTKFVKTCFEEKNNYQCTSLYGKFINVCMRYAHWWCFPVNFTFFEWRWVEHMSIQNQEDYFLFGELNQSPVMWTLFIFQGYILNFLYLFSSVRLVYNKKVIALWKVFILEIHML